MDALPAHYGDSDSLRAALVSFCAEDYTCVLDDCAHLVKRHGDDIERIHTECVQHYGAKHCSIANSRGGQLSL